MPDSPLSVLQVCSASQATYGAVQSLLTLADAQRRAGKRVEFLTFAGKRFGDQVRALGYPVCEVPVRLKIDLIAALAIRKSILRGGFDVVHTHLSTSSVNGALAARLARRPSVATVHGLSGKLSFLFADHLIAVSEEVKRHLVKQGIPPGRISVVYNGLPMEVAPVDRARIRRGMNLREGAIVLGTVSRVTPLKGIGDALRVVASLTKEFPSVHYVLVGDGDGLEEVKQLAGSLGIADRVRFLGYRTDVDICLAAMDLFLFPSHKEAMGIALVEAMRAGLPIVGYATGGVPEVIDASSGVLAPTGDRDALTDAASSLLGAPDRMRTLGMGARARAIAHFSDSAMESATEAVYRGL